jgi:hypothetical protein
LNINIPGGSAEVQDYSLSINGLKKARGGVSVPIRIPFQTPETKKPQKRDFWGFSNNGGEIGI